MKGRNRAGQLRALFAKGVLRGHGRGKGRGSKYHAGRSGQVRNFEKATQTRTRGGLGGNLKNNVRRGTQKAAARKSLRGNHNTNAAKSNAYGGRAVIGAKAAHLRGSGSGGKPKADHSATRAARIAAGHKQLERYAGKQAADYKARLSLVGTPHTASRKAFGKYADTGNKYRGRDKGYLINGNLHERQHRPRIVGQFGGEGAGRAATRGTSVNRTDAVQRAAARALDVSYSKQRGRAFINARDGASLDASTAGRRSLGASEFRSALRDTGAKSFPSARQERATRRRNNLAAQLRAFRKQDATLARQKLLKLKTDSRFADILRNPNRRTR
ncbi:hypothetical protein [Deinococcus petrolearius]|uniref:Uncharacterized protein n=1 Tax=Deinococcus petrolearius TaxID=1751295 RepID=A0ABW1DGW4_9DEIO